MGFIIGFWHNSLAHDQVSSASSGPQGNVIRRAQCTLSIGAKHIQSNRNPNPKLTKHSPANIQHSRIHSGVALRRLLLISLFVHFIDIHICQVPQSITTHMQTIMSQIMGMCSRVSLEPSGWFALSRKTWSLRMASFVDNQTVQRVQHSSLICAAPCKAQSQYLPPLPVVNTLQ